MGRLQKGAYSDVLDGRVCGDAWGKNERKSLARCLIDEAGLIQMIVVTYGMCYEYIEFSV